MSEKKLREQVAAFFHDDDLYPPDLVTAAKIIALVATEINCKILDERVLGHPDDMSQRLFNGVVNSALERAAAIARSVGTPPALNGSEGEK